VHRLLGEQGEYGGADIAATGSVTRFPTEAAAAARATPAAVEPAASVTATAMLVAMVVLVDPARVRIVNVVTQNVLLSIRVLECTRDISTTYHNASVIPSQWFGLDGGMELQSATTADVEACLAVQRRSAVLGYGHIFDQSIYPFPDDVVRAEWVARLASEDQVVIATVDGEPVGTASAHPPRLEALFVVPEQWGTGVAVALHDAALERVAASGWLAAELDVMVDNARARRFYERLGWTADGRGERSPFPPYPKLLGYRRDLD
jgi:GNAT superfamily N-acetyltransferase